MINYLLMATSILLAVSGQLMMKKGMMQFGSFPVREMISNLIPMFLNPWVFFGFVSFGFSSIFWLVVLSRLPLSQVYPMVSVAYVLTAFASIAFFGEVVSPIRWGGIVLIIMGVILISRS